MFCGSLYHLYVAAAFDSNSARQVPVAKVFLGVVVVTGHFFRFRPFSGVCQDVTYEGRAYRTNAIVVYASVARQVRVTAKV